MAAMAELFEQGKHAPADAVVGVAVAANVWKTFDYLWPAAVGTPAAGLRVRVPFGRGNRKTLGFVVATDRPRGHRQLKTVAEVIDADLPLDEKLWQLAEWISRYYLAPLGMVLAAMVPAAVGRPGRATETVAWLLAGPADWPRSLGARQRELLDELHEARRQGVEPLPLEQLAARGRFTRDTVGRLARRGLVRLEQRPRAPESPGEAIEPDPFELNDDQQAVLARLEGALGGGFGVLLLHGVTGSGKTEVYLRAIRRVVATGSQAILLVPEIALATQTLQRLARRMKGAVVLHSGLTAGQRSAAYEQVRDGRASVVIGPRSAVFAPTRKLGLIVVDEEHEASYKQDTAPRYHGRDVAIKRAAIEAVPVLLGSATPSLESLHNVRRGRYRLLELPRRIRGLPMPALHLVELRKEISHTRIELIGRTLAEKMAAALDRNEQIILLMNRRGYASYVFCPSCRWQLECDDCSRPMVFHQSIGLAKCHYCEAHQSVPRICPACDKKLILFGLGIQRIESELARKFPSAVAARMDSDTMTSPRQFRKVFDNFAAGEVDILLGTQMVAKGLDFPRVTLVGIVSADTALVIPDFRAAERTFQLIVQVAGRAGRAERGGQVVVQTLHPRDPAIQFALQHDYAGFVEKELGFRRDAAVPPFVRMVRLVVRHGNATRAGNAAEAVGRRLQELFAGDNDVRLLGPMKCGVFKVRRQFRYQVNCYCGRAGRVQEVLAGELPALAAAVRAEIVPDVDPINLM